MSSSRLQQTLWPDPSDRPATVPGQTPPAYQAERYELPDDERSGPGTRRRGEQAETGHKRDLSFPAAPEPLPVPLVDNHTHIDIQDGRVRIGIADALDVAQDVGVRGIVQVGCDLPSSRWAVEAAESDPRILAAVAIHPNDAPALAEAGELEEALAVLDELAGHERTRAIGETGLDYFRTGPERHALQQDAFRAHIRLAKEHDLALQIHDRDAHDDVVRILLEEGAPERTVFHCFSGDAELARICNEHGWHMSFAGTVTFKNSHGIQAGLREARRELIMVETDAPFLTPHPHRGRPNAPYLVVQTARWIAEHLHTPLEQLCERIDRTTREVYGEH